MSAPDGGPRPPSVHSVLDRPELSARLATSGREAVARAVRSAIDELRASVRGGDQSPVQPGPLALRALALLDADRPALRPVINATGILLHTGLGRAPLAAEAVEAVARVSRGYSNLEIDLDGGGRGRRTAGVEALLREITGAEAAAVVNNNAGATVLALRALALGREVVVSRGELVEIGGSYRLPEIFAAAGVVLREVGTTNKTRLGDYARAIGPGTAALLRVHPSNYRIVGFAESTPIAELAPLAKSRGIACIDDIGSGSLRPGCPPGLADEPTASAGLAAGADLVLFSGDKLLGGPQSGILVGSADAVRRVEEDPLMRALRVDKMTLAALEATLRLAADPALGGRRIPLWSFLTTPVDALRSRAESLAAGFRSSGLEAGAVDSTAFLGGGSAPVDPIASAAVRVAGGFSGAGGESGWAAALRSGDPAVVARVRGGAVWFDLRAVAEGEDASILEAARAASGGPG